MAQWQKLWHYILSRIPDSNLINVGFCEWEVLCPTKEGKAKIAKKAILLDMKISFRGETMIVRY